MCLKVYLAFTLTINSVTQPLLLVRLSEVDAIRVAAVSKASNII